MGVIVAFDYDAWLAIYPEFTATVTSPQANGYFAMATTMHANDGSGPVPNAGLQLSLLNALTAHFAALFNTPSGSTPSTLVGRISNATEGSVTVATEYNAPPSQSMAWFLQTKYGAFYWTATIGYRTMQYRISRNRRGPVPGYGGLI